MAVTLSSLVSAWATHSSPSSCNQTRRWADLIGLRKERSRQLRREPVECGSGWVGGNKTINFPLEPPARSTHHRKSYRALVNYDYEGFVPSRNNERLRYSIILCSSPQTSLITSPPQATAPLLSSTTTKTAGRNGKMDIKNDNN